jgi:integrase
MATITPRPGGYQVKIRLRGHQESATFTKLADAKRWASTTEAAIQEKRYFKTSESERHTLAELIDRYIRDVIPEKGAWAHDQTVQLAWWRSELGLKSLASITPTVVAEARDKLAKGSEGKRRSNATVVRYLAALSHAFSTAVKEWGWTDSNPILKVTKPKEPRGRVRFLSDEERLRLVEACRTSDSSDLYSAVVVALSTGGRKIEIMGLRWPHVDFARHSITLFETKNGEIRSLPLVGHAFDLMLARSKVRRIDTDLVFPAHNSTQPIDLRGAFRTAMKRAGVVDFRWHDLRHTTASYLAMNGASLAEIAEVLGHKTLAMVRRYTHLSQAHTSRVVESMNQKMFG